MDVIKKSAMAHYARQNRAAWAHFGFATKTMRVHHSDSAYLLAYAEVLRCERLLHFVLYIENDDFLEFVATRNMAKTPTAFEMDPENYTLKEGKSLLKKAAYHIRKREENEEAEKLDPVSARYPALKVAHNNLAKAYVEFAQLLENYEAPQVKNV